MTKIIKVLIFCILVIHHSFSEEMIIAKHKIKQPITIYADNMSFNYKKGEAYLSGNIITVQNDLKISAKKMYINFTNISGKNFKIRNIRYEDQVLVNASYIMKGEIANLNWQEETLTMENNVIIIKDKNEIKGKKLIYNFAKGSLNIIGDSHNRSKVTINIK